MQPVITTRIYVLHKITIALKFVLHKFWFANSREETVCFHYIIDMNKQRYEVEQNNYILVIIKPTGK